MKKIIIAGVLGLSMATTIFSYAGTEGEAYGSIQYGLGTYSEDGFDDANPNAIVGRYGKFINDSFSIEGRLGFGVGDDSINDPTIGKLSIEVDSLLGVYGLGHVEINDTSNVYGLLGFSRGELTASAFGISVSDDDTGLSYGVGANIGVSDSLALNLEYIQYLSASDYDFTAIGLGVVFAFE